MKISKGAINVFIVDSQSLFSELFMQALHDVGMNAVSFESIDQMIFGSSSFNPDLIVISINDATKIRIEEIVNVKNLKKDAKVILLIDDIEKRFLSACVGFGINGILSKNYSLKITISALKLIHSGQNFVPVIYQDNIHSNDNGNDFGISTHELEIIEMLSLGLTNDFISKSLKTPVSTVKFRIRSICSKLNVKNRTQIVLTAQKLGLLK